MTRQKSNFVSEQILFNGSCIYAAHVITNYYYHYDNLNMFLLFWYNNMRQLSDVFLLFYRIKREEAWTQSRRWDRTYVLMCMCVYMCKCMTVYLPKYDFASSYVCFLLLNPFIICSYNIMVCVCVSSDGGGATADPGPGVWPAAHEEGFHCENTFTV